MGVVTYQMLMRHLPFEADQATNPMAVMYQVLLACPANPTSPALLAGTSCFTYLCFPCSRCSAATPLVPATLTASYSHVPSLQMRNSFNSTKAFQVEPIDANKVQMKYRQ